MTDRQLDAIVEAANDKAWAELNREDPNAKAAVALCAQAIEAVEQACRLLDHAAELVEHTPETDRVQSLANDLEDYCCFIAAQAERME